MHVLPTAVIAAALALTAADDSDEAGTWNFRTDKPVKVTLLAGSIGAFQGGNYGNQLEGVCENIELKNISKTGAGAFPLKKHFKSQVLDNWTLNVRSRDDENWLILHASVNSIATPLSTNHHLKNIIVLAKMAGMKVAFLSPQPWGRDGNSKFSGLEGLERRDSTQLVTDFVMGRLSARQALGDYADKRPDGADAAWVDLEKPDVRIDIYDSPLRNKTAELRDLEKMKALLLADRTWVKEHADMNETQRDAWLLTDAQRAAEVPRWFMRPELHAFDHIHPNAEGHLIIAQTACPSLPASWGCDCAALGKEA